MTGTAPAGPRPSPRAAPADLAELVRAPAALTVPGDVLAGAVACGRPPWPRTLALAASSVCVYWAGMALNDWADRAEDATERPCRPIPSGRVGPGRALAVAGALTAAGLGIAAAAGGRRTVLRRTLPLACAAWAYDLGLKNTPLGPFAMAAARACNVLHGASGPAALPAAAAVAGHVLAVTRLSRHETRGTGPAEPRFSLAVTAATTAAAAGPAVRALCPGHATTGLGPKAGAVAAGAAALYAATAGRAQLAAAREPSAARVRAAVGAGIHSLLPLQAALVARAGSPVTAVPFALALPLADRLARKVSST